MDEEKSGHDKILELALERFNISEDKESNIRKLALEDLKFSVGEQWDDSVKKNRRGRPCLVMNRIPQFVKQVTNEQRQNRPAIQINPRGDDATVETAEIFQGIVRNIEVNSESKIAYDHAFDMMARMGFAFYQITEDYADDDTLEQEIEIKRIKNPFSVFFDPFVDEPDYSDAMWAFIVKDLHIDEYKSEFPNSPISSLNDFSSIGNSPKGWASKDTIRVAEYFYVVEEEYKIFHLTSGEVVKEGDLEFEEAEMRKLGLIEKERTLTNRKVKWAKINGMEVLEERDLLGRWIPIVPVLGDDVEVDGIRRLTGMVRDAKDPQRLYNYYNSVAAEAIALAPKAPWIGAKGVFENEENTWNTANILNHPFLEYNQIDINGQPAPPPQRNVMEPPIQALAMMIRQADNDMKAIFGIYDSSLGEAGPEQSGKAILARQGQSDKANMNYADNLARSIRFTGRILLDLIPKIYDTPRIKRIIKPDSTVDHVVVYNGKEDREAAEGMKTDSITKIFDMSVGRYDVSVSVGPSYQSKRQEAAASQIEFVQAFPQEAAKVMDLMVRNFDWPGANEMADRIKKMLPPELQGDDGQDPKMRAMKAESMVQQAMVQNEQLTKALQEQTETINNKKMELESKERIAERDNQTKIALAQMQIESQGSLEFLKQQFSTITSRLDKMPSGPETEQ